MLFKCISVIFLLALFGKSFGLDCSSVIVKESEGVLNWLGNITFTVPFTTTAAGWTMELQFDQQYTGIGVWDVWTRNHGAEKYAEFWNRDHNPILIKDSRFSFRFRINYFTNVTQPQPTSLKFFDVELCK